MADGSQGFHWWPTSLQLQLPMLQVLICHTLLVGQPAGCCAVLQANREVAPSPTKVL